MTIEEGPVCPVPLAHRERIVMGHGSGGKMSHDLVARLFMPYLGSPAFVGRQRRRRGQYPTGGAAGYQHRFACGLAIVLSGRRYW